ncbi:HdeD family acid-resistance protein [Commensalibacter communis]|uniref:HdeD family acid-resistance protein n=1 Tax=Commensalibacter communis TaxID=2972786 RepID=UPI0022FF6A9E|nr:HdeD family acid-resistance protein [Commensalibacter communis]CAI3935733.1 Acid resistance membrane protein HdeD [Commensalibacter communis]CAI3942397.1 Acid resistance membrane protein HdeD [Commensalibacter communis]
MEELFAQKWKWFIGLGIITLILGCLALLDTVLVTIAVVIALGVVLILTGIAQIFHACYVKGWKGFIFSALAGIVYLIGGILLVKGPVLGSLILTTFLAVCFCFGGIMRIMIALNHKSTGGWGFLMFSGVMGIIVGAMLFIQPLSGLWFIGFMIAFDLIFVGAGWIQLGLNLKNKIKQ